MAKRDRLSLRWVLTILMGVSILTALAGPRAGDPLRRAFRYVQIMPADPVMYVLPKLRGGDKPSPKPLSEDEARQLRERLELVEYAAEFYYEQMVAYQTEAMDLQNFQDVFGPAEGLGCVLIPARVVADESLSYGHGRTLRVRSGGEAVAGDLVTTRRLITDRRKALGKFGVLANNVLVGRLGSSDAYTAQLLLVTDSNFQVWAKIVRDPNRPRDIAGVSAEQILPPIPCHAVGDGRAGLIVKDVPADAKVLPGDALLTETSNSFLPIPVRVGTVVAVEDDPQQGSFQTVRVMPDADLDGLRNVYIVYPMRPPPEGR